MKRKLLLLNLINKSIKNEKFDLDELEIMDIARKAMKSCLFGRSASVKGAIYIPMGYTTEADDYWAGRGQRDILTEQHLIGTDQKYIINPIGDESVFIKAGATFLPTVQADIKVPSFSGIQASWVADGEEPDADGDDIIVGGASFAPKRMYVCLDVPMRLLIQGGAEVEQWLRDCIQAAIAAKVDSTIGGVLAADTKAPQGMGYAITTGTTTAHVAIIPEYNDIVALEKSVSDLKLPASNFAYITNAEGRRILRKTSIDGSAGPMFKDGKLNDYPAHISNCISSAAGSDGLGNLILFGNWKDLGIIQFGAYDISVDPYTLKHQGKVQLSINSYWDFKGLRGSVATGGETQDNMYAHSFSSAAIKS